MQTIRNYLETLVKISEEEWADFSSCLQPRLLPKKTPLLKEGQVCDFAAFIVSGGFYFYSEIDGEEKIMAFFFKGDLASDYKSFISGLPSGYNIQSLEETEVYLLTKKDLNRLYDRHKNIERLGRLFAERLFVTMSNRLDSILLETPQQRYADLLHRGSKLLQQIPQYMLASYLGVKPESLVASEIENNKGYFIS